MFSLSDFWGAMSPVLQCLLSIGVMTWECKLFNCDMVLCVGDEEVTERGDCHEHLSVDMLRSC